MQRCAAPTSDNSYVLFIHIAREVVVELSLLRKMNVCNVEENFIQIQEWSLIKVEKQFPTSSRSGVEAIR